MTLVAEGANTLTQHLPEKENLVWNEAKDATKAQTQEWVVGWVTEVGKEQELESEEEESDEGPCVCVAWSTLRKPFVHLERFSLSYTLGVAAALRAGGRRTHGLFLLRTAPAAPQPFHRPL